MESIYENSGFILSTVSSDVNCSQYKATGNSSSEREHEREVSATKWTKVLLVIFAVSLVFALGGLCFLFSLYVSVSMQLSAQETNSTLMARELEELTANYTRVRKHLTNHDLMVRKMEELTANYTSVTERLSFYDGESSNYGVKLAPFHRKLYFFSCDQLTWSSSRAFCMSKGADLVTITSQSEQQFLYSKMKEFYWIGLSDLETEGHWVWVNNQTLGQTGIQFWYKRESEKSEPDNWKQDDPTGENCAIVKNSFSFLNSWFDVSCNYKMKFICEKKY